MKVFFVDSEPPKWPLCVFTVTPLCHCQFSKIGCHTLICRETEDLGHYSHPTNRWTEDKERECLSNLPKMNMTKEITFPKCYFLSYLCICMYGRGVQCTCVCAHIQARRTLVILYCFPPYSFETLNGELGWQLAEGNLVILLSLSTAGLGYRCKQPHIAFYVSSVDSNSGPYSCVASTLILWAIPQPGNYFSWWL